ncbi:glycosyltransferase family 1 protein [Psychrobacillus sp. INOP01]|uniref:glycosyltransferase family 1 protein n=1 Tax=Psychrobacillus sp. INOP01 TaxID=2829187 RepID=UPI001BAB3067|nr:glycosyltransferase family 1 protein [Psychrobacillus sp. INOP01]QUG40594.1 glycosyltransferase family 1 protein [Psychrobacillus sp. INOP01]
MIRVLQIVGAMDRGGIETFLMNIYRNIDRNKVQFDFLVHTDKKCAFDEEIKSLGGNIFSVVPRRQGYFKNKKSLDEFFKTNNEYKVVHQHLSSLTYVEPLRAAESNNILCRIVHSHNTRQGGSKIHKYIHRINQFSIKSYATDYFACSDLAAKWTYPKKLYNDHKFKVINNGINSEKFIFHQAIREQKRKELGIVNKFVIGHVGRFHPQKNHDFVIDVFKKIHDKNKDSVLMLVGDGEHRLRIERKVKDLGLSRSVIFTGVRTDVPELFQAMDMFLFPSLYEGLGIVLIEAQASGLKCFTSDRVVPKEVKMSNILLNFISLEQSPQKWADEILKCKGYARKDTTDIIKKAEFDIHPIAEELQKWYELKAHSVLITSN